MLSSGWTVLEAATELAIVAAQHVQCTIGVSAESYCSEDQTHLDGNAVAGLDDSLATLAAVTSDCAEAVSAKLAGGGNHSVVEAAIGTLVGIIGDAMRERLSLNGDGSFATSSLTTGAFSLAVARAPEAAHPTSASRLIGASPSLCLSTVWLAARPMTALFDCRAECRLGWWAARSLRRSAVLQQHSGLGRPDLKHHRPAPGPVADTPGAVLVGPGREHQHFAGGSTPDRGSPADCVRP